MSLFDSDLAQSKRWQHLVNVSDDAVPLFWAGLVVAADEYPDLDFEAQEQCLRAHQLEIERELSIKASPMERLRVLNTMLFHELGFRGNHAEYYDPRNSYINEVLMRRLGIPISLGVLHLELAKRLHVPLEGVAFPGHFLVQMPVDEGVLVLDPFERGRSLDVDELKIRARPHFDDRDVADSEIAQLLRPAKSHAILLRMLRNLKQIYAQKEDWDRALRVTDRILLLDPKQYQERRDRGVFYLRVGHTSAGVSDLAYYLQHEPKASDGANIRQLLLESGAKTSRLN